MESRKELWYGREGILNISNQKTSDFRWTPAVNGVNFHWKSTPVRWLWLSWYHEVGFQPLQAGQSDPGTFFFKTCITWAHGCENEWVSSVWNKIDQIDPHTVYCTYNWCVTQILGGKDLVWRSGSKSPIGIPFESLFLDSVSAEISLSYHPPK